MNQKINLETTLTANEVAMQPHGILSRTLRLALPIVIIVIGVALAWYLVTATPTMTRVTKPRESRLVEIMTATSSSESVRITAWGEVKPAQEVILKAQVSGVVEKLLHSLEPGSAVEANATLLQLEQAEYDAVRIQKQAELDQAMANLDIERGNQAVARSEYTLLGDNAGAAQKKLMLREPQLQAASAQVKAAQAALSAAELNWQRTLIRAPFSGVIKEQFVNVGSHLAVNGDVITLTGTHTAWVEVSLPINLLPWVRIPDAEGNNGSVVTLFYDQVWHQGQHRTGKVVRLLSDLESTGRMARVLVEVEDPLALQLPENQPPLLMGSFVRAELEGKRLSDVVVIPAALLHENDTVWVLANDLLQVRSVEVAYRNQEKVYVRSGIQAGDQLVSSVLATATDGMPLRVASDKSESAQ